MKKAISWLRHSFEDHESKSSFKRLSTFMIMVLIAYVVIWKLETEVHLRALYALLTTLLLLIGIVTTQNILTFWRGNKDQNGEQ